MIREIRNEIETIVYFSQNCHLWGAEIISMSSSSFPDAIIVKDGTSHRVEFEYRASNFILHKHDETGCDLVICWINDLAEFVLPIITLSDELWYTSSIFNVSEQDKIIYSLKRENRNLRNDLANISEKLKKYATLYENAKTGVDIDDAIRKTLEERIITMLKWGVSYNAISLAFKDELKMSRTKQLEYFNHLKSIINS